MGLGIISQLNNFSGLLYSIIPIGIIGLTIYISEYYSENKIQEINYLIRTVILHNFPIALIISVLLLIFPKVFSELLYSDSNYWSLIIIFSFSIPFGMLSGILDIYIKSVRAVKWYVVYTIISSVLSLVIFILFLKIFNLLGAVIALLSIPLSNLIVGSIVLRKIKLFPHISKFKKVSSKVIKDIYKIGIASAFLLATQQFVYLTMKSIIANKLGISSVGIYQSVFSISNSFFVLFYGVIATYSIPKLSTLKRAEEINLEINQTLKLLLLFYTPLIIISYVLREIVILTLYSKDFFGANELLFYQLMGDFVKSISWVFGLWLLPGLRIKEWVLFDVIFNINFLVSFYYLFNSMNHNLIAISVAYLIAFSIHLIINFIYLKHSLKFVFIENNALIITTSFAVMLITFLISDYNITIGYFIFIPLLLVWFKICIKKDEIVKLRNLIADKLKN